MLRRLLFFLLISYILGSACKSQRKPLNIFDANPKLIHVYDLQDRRRTDSLLYYVQHQNKVLRRHAALAFASVQDSAALPALYQLLSDPESAIRAAAAYAIGQTRILSSQSVLLEALETETDVQVRAHIMEATGKCADSVGVAALVGLKVSTHAEQYGQLAGLYRAMLKRQTAPEGVELAITHLQNSSNDSVRLMAAHYLARMPGKKYDQHRHKLTTAFKNEQSLEVRIHLASALAGIDANALIPFADSLLQNPAQDYRISVALIRSLAQSAHSSALAVLAAQLSHSNPNVVFSAAESIKSFGKNLNREYVATVVNQSQLPRARALLLGCAMLYLDRDSLSRVVKEELARTQNIYEKGFLLKALASHPAQYIYITEMLSAPQSPLPLRTVALEALLEIRASPEFDQLGDVAARDFDDILRNTVLSSDAALVALGAGALRNRRWNYKERLTDLSFLEQARQQLKLPAETETLIEIEKTLAYLKGLPEPEVPAPAFNHPVNWALVTQIAARQKAEIITSKGKITLELLVEDAPGSVANFITLAREGAYNQRVFHRIVPNFVVQGGCPRGDGHGSPDYSIRSEFAPLSYSEGMVGMASAGKDTEGSQWFITHVATPHLDGRYTIFARVTGGVEVVHRLELGDVIETVRLVP